MRTPAAQWPEIAGFWPLLAGFLMDCPSWRPRRERRNAGSLSEEWTALHFGLRSGSRFKSENVLHGVEAGFLAKNPLGGAEGAVGKSVSAAGFVGEFEAFSGSGEQDGVVADNVAAAQGMHADFVFGSGADDSLAAMFQGFVRREIAGLGEDVCESCGGAAGGILFVMVVHFDDFEVEGVSQDFRRFASKPEKGVDAGGVVGGPNYGNFVGEGLDVGVVFVGVSSGADDDGFGLGGGLLGDFLGGVGGAEVDDDVGGFNGRRNLVADVHDADDFELGIVCGAANQRLPHSSFGSGDG